MVHAEVGKKHKMGQLTVSDSVMKKARRGGGQAPAIVPADAGPLPRSQPDGQASGLFLPAPPPGFIRPASGGPAAPPTVAAEAAGLRAEPMLPHRAGGVQKSGSQQVPLRPGMQPQHAWAATAASNGKRSAQDLKQASAPLPVPHSSVSAAKQEAQPRHNGSFMAGLRADLGSSMPLGERPPLAKQLPTSLAALPAYCKPATPHLPACCRPAVPSQTQQRQQMQRLLPQLPGKGQPSVGALPAGAVAMPVVSGAPHDVVPHRQVHASQQQQPCEAQHVKPVPNPQQAAATQPQHGQQAASTTSSGALTVSGQPSRNIVRLPGSHAQVAAIREADGFSPRFQQSSIKMGRHWARTCNVAERTQEG